MTTSRKVHIIYNPSDVTYYQRINALLAQRGYNATVGGIAAGIGSTIDGSMDPAHPKLEFTSDPSHVVIVLIGAGTASSELVNQMIADASIPGLRTIGIWVPGGREIDLPENFNVYGHALVGGNPEKIIGAIESEHNDWCVPKDDGNDDDDMKDRNPFWDLDHLPCQDGP